MPVHEVSKASVRERDHGGSLSSPYATTFWGDGTAPPLYCPAAERDDKDLADEVDDRLIAWAREVGFSDDYLDKLRNISLGRLIVLTHSHSDDLDRLLLAAQMNAAWWAADDYYADDSALGAVPEQLPTRIVSAMTAMEPLPGVGEYLSALEAEWASDPVWMALRSGTHRLRQLASPAQVGRVCHAAFSLLVSWSAHAEWRRKGSFSTVGEYLAMRQFDSFYVSMTLIDVVDGYELPADLFYDPRVCRAARQAGTASTLLNDLYSVARDAADERPVGNLVLIIAAEQRCSLREATAHAVELHNTLVRDFETSCRALEDVPCVELQRYLHGLKAWMGGAFAWHDACPRYKHP